MRLFYTDKVRQYFLPVIISSIFEYIPTFSFSMAFGLVSCVASKDWDSDLASWKDGVKYSKELYHEKFYR